MVARDGMVVRQGGRKGRTIRRRATRHSCHFVP
jgi:hypothetical protein